MSGLSSSNAAKDIFLAAIEMKSTEGRTVYLRDACGNDSTLRQRVEELIEAHERPESLLNDRAPVLPPSSPNVTVALENSELCGSRIGPYKILQLLGEGGMGLVYLAEQQRPVRRQVALKIIKHGMDSKKFIARFEAERQALAMMDHPNIAQVLEAGCTDKGRPYFVMELVKGVPISDFCDENRLTTRERLELFLQVCHAVHHAHQKGIIHRDIKPSNVLVALYDQKPVPKVIDFGVAKATSHQLTEKTLFTEVGSILGTWEYMSPEQAVLNQLDVDTRTDVYSLGVLLYELLTGETPLDRQRLHEAQIIETLRLIREEEPPKPSTRISSLGQRATATAAYRKTKPESLASEIRGDLDWIVMKALAKERSRRYDSASRLSEDIERYLKNELVEARPPSTWYQMQKFYKRHKLVASSLAGIMLALSTGLAVAIWGVTRASLAKNEAIRSNEELRAKDTELRTTLRTLSGTLLEQGVTLSLTGNETAARRVVKHLRELEATDSADKLEGYIDIQVGEYANAIGLLNQLVSRRPNTPGPLALLALAHDAAGDPTGYLESYYRLCEAVHDRQAVPREDLFFLIKGLIWDPERGVEFGEEAFRLRPSPFTLLELARTKMDLANAAGRPELIDGALRDIDAARRVLRTSNSLSRIESLASCILAAKTAKSAGEEERYSTILERAKEFVFEIQAHEHPSNWELIYVGAYYREIQDIDRSLNYFLRAVKEYFSDFAIYHYVAFALEANRTIPEDVMARLKRERVGPASSIALAHILIAEGDRDGAVKISDEITWLDARLDVLRLAGKRLNAAEIDTMANQVISPPPSSPDAFFREHYLAFHKGKISAETLIERASRGQYRKRWLAEAYWSAGIGELSEGHRKAALRLFRQALRQGVLTGTHTMVGAYAATLERSVGNGLAGSTEL